MQLKVSYPSRLDLFLSVETGRSRSFIKHQILSGKVSLNGLPIDKPSQKIRPEDLITCEFEENAPSLLAPVEKDLEILHEDEDLLILNKEQGWVVHPASAHRGDTVVHYLLHHFKNASDFLNISPSRPGIVHRLDRGTSGCLVIAKHRSALENLSKQFKDRLVEKEYEAIVWGKSKPKGLIATAIGRHRSDRKRMSSKTRVGKTAETRFETLGQYEYFSWVRLLPKTGRTHQLRVHLSENGNPIVADNLYGKKRNLEHFGDNLRTFLKGVKYPFLHAKRITIHHPRTGERLQVEAKHPANFDTMLRLLTENEKRVADERE